MRKSLPYFQASLPGIRFSPPNVTITIQSNLDMITVYMHKLGSRLLSAEKWALIGRVDSLKFHLHFLLLLSRWSVHSPSRLVTTCVNYNETVPPWGHQQSQFLRVTRPLSHPRLTSHFYAFMILSKQNHSSQPAISVCRIFIKFYILYI
jgi:hypothetical protein